MRVRLLAAGIAAAVFLPSAGIAQVSCEQQNKNRTVGTIAGGSVGAIIGGAVAGRNDRATGAILGAIGGAILGNQLSKSKADCAHAFGYYDGQGAWHANADRSEAAGYFDRSGQWVSGAPNGYYDADGDWRATRGSEGGYNDANGHWVPARVSGYYDDQNRWVAAPSEYASTSYSAGRPAPYDAQPRPDDRSRPDAGRYDPGNGRQQGYDASRDQVYRDNRAAQDDQRDVLARENDLRERIADGRRNRSLSRSQSKNLLAQLQSISDRETRMPHRDGRLSGRDEAIIQGQLDTLDGDLRHQLRN